MQASIRGGGDQRAFQKPQELFRFSSLKASDARRWCVGLFCATSLKCICSLIIENPDLKFPISRGGVRWAGGHGEVGWGGGGFLCSGSHIAALPEESYAMLF